MLVTKNQEKILLIRKIVVPLLRSKTENVMNEVPLNDAELELIEAIRNIRKAYPNGYENLVWYAQQLFDELVEMPPVDEDDY